MPCAAEIFPAGRQMPGGVDLNHNFDAGFELCKQAEQSAGILGLVRENTAVNGRKANRKHGPSAGLFVRNRYVSYTLFIHRERKFITNTANILLPERL